MSERLSKRRKTSPLRTGDDENRRTPTRASFLSPTKASLSRFNPNLLAVTDLRRRTSSQGIGASRPILRSKSLPKLALGESNREEVPSGLSAQDNDPPAAMSRLSASAAIELPAVSSPPAFDSIVPSIEPASVRRGGDDVDDMLPSLPVGTANQLFQDVPRRGAVQTTPSKRPRRSKLLAEKIIRSSPSKSALIDVSNAKLPSNVDSPSNLDGASEGVDRHKDQAELDDTEVQKQIHNDIANLKLTSLDLGTLEAERSTMTKELAIMRDEIKQYEHQIRLCEKEDEGIANDRQSSEVLADLIDSVENPGERSGAKPQSLSHLLNSFLPFAKTASILQDKTKESDNKPILSHAPIELDDPVPFLELFSTFSNTSQIKVIPDPSRTESDLAVTLLHKMSVTSRDGLFASRINLTIDATKSVISGVNIDDLPRWTKHELGTWLEGKARDKDANALFWGLGSYFDMSLKRARCWAQCKRNFGHLLSNHPIEPAQKVKSTPKSTKRRRSKRAMSFDGDSSHDEEEVSGIGHSLEARGEMPIRRDDLSKCLGEDSLIFRDADVSLLVSWKIAMDWTGDAQSKIYAEAAFTDTWNQSDDRGSLKKITQTFNSLLHEKGVYESISVMLRLLSLKE